MDASDEAASDRGERAQGSAQQRQEQLRVDEAGREVIWQGRRLDLSPMEFETLSYLVGREGQTVSFAQLLQAVWHTSLDQGGSLDQVRSTVKRLRRRLTEEPGHPRYLTSVRGVGYRLELGPQTCPPTTRPTSEPAGAGSRLEPGPQTSSSKRSLASLPVQMKVLILVGLALALVWLLWVRPAGAPGTLVWYRGHQVPIGLLQLFGRGSSCGHGPGGINCFDSLEEMEAALGVALPDAGPQAQDEVGGKGDLRIPPPD